MNTDEYSIDPYVYPDGTPYVIYWTSIPDVAALDDWLAHLRNKTWWTDEMDKEFIAKVEERLGIKPSSTR